MKATARDTTPPNMRKDLHLVLELAHELGVTLYLGPRARSSLTQGGDRAQGARVVVKADQSHLLYHGRRRADLCAVIGAGASWRAVVCLTAPAEAGFPLQWRGYGSRSHVKWIPVRARSTAGQE